jgi:hypothetical protein
MYRWQSVPDVATRARMEQGEVERLLERLHGCGVVAALDWNDGRPPVAYCIASGDDPSLPVWEAREAKVREANEAELAATAAIPCTPHSVAGPRSNEGERSFPWDVSAITQPMIDAARFSFTAEGELPYSTTILDYPGGVGLWEADREADRKNNELICDMLVAALNAAPWEKGEFEVGGEPAERDAIRACRKIRALVTKAFEEAEAEGSIDPDALDAIQVLAAAVVAAPIFEGERAGRTSESPAEAIGRMFHEAVEAAISSPSPPDADAPVAPGEPATEPTGHEEDEPPVSAAEAERAHVRRAERQAQSRSAYRTGDVDATS